MISSWLTLRDLEYVVALAKFEHFGKAAEDCRVSQPSLSTQIKKIEGYLGIELFERTNRKVSTTPGGRKLAELAEKILSEAAKIPDLLSEEKSARASPPKIGVIYSASALIPNVLSEIRKTYLNQPISLREGTTQELVKLLKSGVLDFVIAANPVREKGLQSSILFFEPFVLAAPKGHPLLEKAVLKPADLRVSEMVLLEEGHCLRDQTVHTCSVNRRGHPRSFHANSLETLKHLIASGAGYTLLPKLATRDHAMSNLIGYKNFVGKNVGRDIILLYRERSLDKNSFKILHQILNQSMSNL